MKKEDFRKLIDYYHQYVIEDREFKIATEVAKDEKKKKRTYLNLEEEEFELFQKNENFPADSIQRIKERLGINDEKAKVTDFVIGFPIFHQKEYKKIIPAFVFILTEMKELVLVDYEEFRFNSTFFEEMGIDLNGFRRQVEALNLTEPINGKKRNIVEELMKTLEQFISTDPEEQKEKNIYTNAASFFICEKSNFTKGLEFELKEIAKLNSKSLDDFFSESALKYLFEPNRKISGNEDVSMFTPLNASQKEAVKMALSSGITNIQGPPGTGKSDVVINIIFNAFLKNKSILFSSHNHKAIETVMSRIDKYLDQLPFMLKLGRSEGQKDLVSILKANIQEIQDYNNFMPAEDQKLRDLSAKSKQIEREIDQLLIEQEEINNTRLSISEEYRKYIKGRSVNYEKIYYNLQKLNSIPKAALISPRIKKMVRYHKAILRAEKLKRVEELTDLIFRKREELLNINKAILILTIRKNYSFRDENEKKLLNEYQRLLSFWIDNQFNSKQERVEFKEKFLPIRKFLLIWTVSNLSVSGQLPLSPGIFDYVIIDEASQCDIPSTLCLMLRAKSLIVVGDEKQLNHITNLSSQRRKTLFKQYFNLMKFNEWEFGVSSILSLIAHRSKNIDGSSEIMLDEHFRSKKEIISFSNNEFYGNKLKIRTNYLELNNWGEKPTFEWIDVKDEYIPLYNKFILSKEIEKCKEILSVLIDSEEITSIGITSPFRLQVQKILEACTPLLSKNKGNKEIVIDTIHRFQGDEKDVMIFSLGVSYSIEIEGKLKNNNEFFYSGNDNLI
ncbi:MAG: hypothetical protein B6D45_00270, partial [Ignavibacteriales bacterium UTCHB3]